MKLLLSAYACAPNRGSDHGVGWNWITEASRQGHTVWALVSPAHRQSISEACRNDPDLSRIHWIFPEVAGWPLRPGIEPRSERIYYLLWQLAALRLARGISKRVAFDLVHHVTWGGIRAPSYLGALGRPLVIGPIGGGETSPAALRSGLGLRGRVLEAVRDFSSWTAIYNPVFRPGFMRAAVIFAHTEATRNLFPGALRDKTIVFTPINLPSVPAEPARASGRNPTRVLFAGRLIYWKGVHIAVQAFAEVSRRIPNARFTIVGEGPERARLEAFALEHRIQDRVDFVRHLPQQALFGLYDSHDLFLFPSLHDAGGFVVLEALSRGLPVVCLDLGGPADMVTAECGVVVATEGRNTSQVALAIADAVCQLFVDPQQMMRLSAGGVARARQFVLAARVKEFYDIVTRFVRTEHILPSRDELLIRY